MEKKHIDIRSFRKTVFGDCPYCHGTVKRNGKTKKGVQRFKCNSYSKTFTGRKDTIIFSSKLKPQQIKRLLSMLIDGTTIKQACDQVGVSTRTGVLYLRKLQELFKIDDRKPLFGEIWIDETYINAAMKDFEYSDKLSKTGKLKKKAGLSDNKLVIYCGIDSFNHCFAILVDKGRPSLIEVENIYKKLISPNNLVYHDDTSYGSSFAGSKEVIVNSKSEEAHSLLNPINRFINLIQRCFKVHLRVRRHNIQKYLDIICFMYENKLKNFNELKTYIYKKIFLSGKTLKRKDISD